MRSLFATLGLGLGSLITLSAAEVAPYLDIRGGVQFTESDYESARETNDIDSDWETAYNFTGHLLTSKGLGTMGGFIFGGGAVFSLREDEADGVDVDYQSLVIRATVGYGYAFTPQLQLEALPYAGVGYAEIEEVELSQETSDEDIEIQYGIEVNLVYTTAARFQIGVGVGYGFRETDFDDDREIDIEQEDLVGHLFAGFRF